MTEYAPRKRRVKRKTTPRVAKPAAPAEPGIEPGLSIPAETGVSAAASLPPAGEDAVSESASAPKRRRRASVGGQAMKLSAPQRPGFHRRWMNDTGNRLADATDLGYDYVTEQGIKSDNPGSRVSRLVGTKPNGEPLHAFLMETPNELYAEGVAEKEAQNRLIDEAISAGSPTDGPIAPASESYGQGSIQRDR